MISIDANKIDGKLNIDDANNELLKLFLESIPDGGKILITYEINNADKSYAQLSKIHKCIRELSAYTGHTFEEMKKEIKDRSGLYINNNYKSFSDCSKEELSLAIETACSIGERIGCYLY